MNDKQFIETYCLNCGTQRCEGIGTEWFEGCQHRWNHDSYDTTTEFERLNKMVKSCEYNLNINKRTHCSWYYKNTEGMNGEAVFHFPFCSCEACPLTNEDVRVDTMTERGEKLKYVNRM